MVYASMQLCRIRFAPDWMFWPGVVHRATEFEESGTLTRSEEGHDRSRFSLVLNDEHDLKVDSDSDLFGTRHGGC